jgi:hypothetical protein
MMMTDDARDKVVELDRQRHSIRETLSGDIEQAKYDLNPKTMARRWTNRKRAQIANLADNGKQSLKKNAPLIGLASAAILLFAARKPISNAINHLRERAQRSKDQKS